MRGLFTKATQKLLLKSNQKERGTMAGGLSGETLMVGSLGFGFCYLADILIRNYFSHFITVTHFLWISFHTWLRRKSFYFYMPGWVSANLFAFASQAWTGKILVFRSGFCWCWIWECHVRDFSGVSASSRVQQRSWPYGLWNGPCHPAGNGAVSQTTADTELTLLVDIRCWQWGEAK